MMNVEIRSAACPRECGGTLVIHEHILEEPGPDGSPVPVGREVIGVRCSAGCQLRTGEVPPHA